LKYGVSRFVSTTHSLLLLLLLLFALGTQLPRDLHIKEKRYRDMTGVGGTFKVAAKQTALYAAMPQHNIR
jgi:hypothetical protein